MVDRRDVGSWLEGPEATRSGELPAYPEADLGLPPQGAGSIASTVRRAIALFIDWGLCSLIAAALMGYRWGEPGLGSFKPLLVFVIENVLLVGTLGTTFGHRLLSLQVLRVDFKPASTGNALIRTVLLALVLPAVIWDKDQRGFHDRLAGTVIVNSK